MCTAHFIPSKGHLLNDMRKAGILPVKRDCCHEPEAALGVWPALGTTKFS